MVEDPALNRGCIDGITIPLFSLSLSRPQEWDALVSWPCKKSSEISPDGKAECGLR